MSWIFLEIPLGNLLEICSVKFVDTLVQWRVMDKVMPGVMHCHHSRLHTTD